MTQFCAVNTRQARSTTTAHTSATPSLRSVKQSNHAWNSLPKAYGKRKKAWENPKLLPESFPVSFTRYREKFMKSLWTVSRNFERNIDICIPNTVDEYRKLPRNCALLWYAIKYIRPKPILNSNLAKSRSSITSMSFVQSFWNFAQSTAVSLPCSVQNFKTIE